MNVIKDLTNTNYTKGNNRKIEYIVMHYVGAVSSAKNNASYFKNTYRGASAHYFVDDNDIYQVVEDKDISWHCGSDKYYNNARNSNSIGIEMCCIKKNGKLDISEATENKAIELVKELMKKYDIDVNHICRHYDVSHKICPAPMVNDKDRWNDFKSKLGQANIPGQEKQDNVIATVKVTANDGLNLRKEPNTSSSILKAFVKGTSLKIYEIKNNWGKTNGGWVCLDYTSYKKDTNSSNQNKKYTTGRYVVNCEVLTVRTGPGTNYNWKKYSELTANAQSQVYSKCGYKPNGLCAGVVCDVSQVSGNWGKIPSRLDLFRLLQKAITTYMPSKQKRLRIDFKRRF